MISVLPFLRCSKCKRIHDLMKEGCLLMLHVPLMPWIISPRDSLLRGWWWYQTAQHRSITCAYTLLLSSNTDWKSLRPKSRPCPLSRFHFSQFPFSFFFLPPFSVQWASRPPLSLYKLFWIKTRREGGYLKFPDRWILNLKKGVKQGRQIRVISSVRKTNEKWARQS